VLCLVPQGNQGLLQPGDLAEPDPFAGLGDPLGQVGSSSRSMKWTRPRMIFVNLSDLFHEDIPFAYIEQVFEVMGRVEHHTFQILTKRHERLAELVADLPWHPNAWIGVSAGGESGPKHRLVNRAVAARAA
jgi:protein gp37